jgi:hypothetical protein
MTIKIITREREEFFHFAIKSDDFCEKLGNEMIFFEGVSLKVSFAIPLNLPFIHLIRITIVGAVKSNSSNKNLWKLSLLLLFSGGVSESKLNKTIKLFHTFLCVFLNFFLPLVYLIRLIKVHNGLKRKFLPTFFDGERCGT